MKKKTINILFILLMVVGLDLDVNAQKQTYGWRDEVELLKRVDQLPQYRSNQHVEQISSYDRKGGNDDGFDGTYSYVRKENGKLVLADLKGPGVVNRIWTPTPTDDTLSFYFDGEQEPRLQIKFSDLFSGEVFPFIKPICGNEIGGYYSYIPIPYQQSLKIVFSGDKMLFHQIQYRNLPEERVKSWTGDFSPSDRALLSEVSTLWSDISPQVESFVQGLSEDVKIEEKVFTIHPGEEVSFFESNHGGRIVGFDLDGGTSFEGLYKDVILSAIWDDEAVEAIYAPVADFFGYAFGGGAMRSLLIGKRGSTNYCYLPMPYDHNARLKMIYQKRDHMVQAPISVKAKVYYSEKERNIAEEGKLYTVWKREQPEKGKYYEFLQLQGRGHYIGTIHQAQGLRPGMTLFFEGDDITHVDGKMRIHGTGSEDYYNGGWYALLDRWDRGISLALHGSLDYSLPMARTGGYRFFLSDKMSFEKDISHVMEHGPEGNEFPVDYTSLAFFYNDRPLKKRMEPTEILREVYLPKEHEYFPQLMQLTPGGGAQISFEKGVRMLTSSQHMVRVMLNDVPEGKYRLAISYFERTEGAEFSVWQRQNKLSDWKSSYGEKELLKERINIGDIELTKQTNSITFHIRKQGDQQTQFELERIYLERLEE